jgi:hypothetical protein
MNMVIVSADQNWDMSFRLHDGRKVDEKASSQFFIEPRRALFGAEDAMNDDLGERLGHDVSI